MGKKGKQGKSGKKGNNAARTPHPQSRLTQELDVVHEWYDGHVVESYMCESYGWPTAWHSWTWEASWPTHDQSAPSALTWDASCSTQDAAAWRESQSVYISHAVDVIDDVLGSESADYDKNMKAVVSRFLDGDYFDDDM